MEAIMAGQTLSAYVTEEVAKSLRLEAKREGRTDGQVAGQAIRFFVSLPREARMSMAALDGLATDAERRWALNEIARVLHIAEAAMTERRMAEQLRHQIPEDASEEDLDRMAVEWTQGDETDSKPAHGRR
jgi:hypothetical protein